MKWIPVNEKLPDCDDKWGISKIVLCLDARGRAGFGIYQNGEKQLYHAGWFTGGGVGEDSVTVTHWMPLPEPPKEDNFYTWADQQRREREDASS